MKTYTITVETNEETSVIKLTRTNEGFSAIELIGILTHAQNEILDMFAGKSMESVDVIERKTVK